MKIRPPHRSIQDGQFHLALLSEGFCWLCKSELVTADDGVCSHCVHCKRMFRFNEGSITEMIPLPPELHRRDVYLRHFSRKAWRLSVRMISGEIVDFHEPGQWVPSNVTHIGLDFTLPDLKPIMQAPLLRVEGRYVG